MMEEALLLQFFLLLLLQVLIFCLGKVYSAGIIYLHVSIEGHITLFCFSTVFFVAITDYKQSLQFEDLNEHKRNIHFQVCVYFF
jgi:hypothetical protein